MRISRPLALAASVVALSLPLAACGSGEEDPAKTLEDAVSAVSAKSSAEVKVATDDPEDGKSTAEGKISWKAGSEGADFVMRMPDDKEFAEMAGADGESRMLVGKDALYMEMDPSQLGGKKWLKLGSEDAGSEEPGALPTNGPEPVIAALATADDLKKAGSEKVNGQDADHYTGTVDVAKLGKTKLKGVSDEARDNYVSELKDSGLKKVRLEVWIGDDDLAVRTAKSGKTAKGQVKETTDILGYGDGFKLETPPAADTATLEDLLAGVQ